MKKEIISRGYGDNQVAMANSVVRSAHNLSLTEKRLIATAITLRNNQDRNGYIRIDVGEYAETFDLSIQNAYKQCKEALHSIRNKWVMFSEKHPDDKAKHRGGGFGWCISYHYNDGEGTLDMALNPYLMPYIQGLENEFTVYKLSNTTAFRSAYTWRLYELLKQFGSTGVCVIGVEDFRHAMECTDYYKGNFARLRTKIIEPAIKELEAKTNVIITLKTRRTGRKITILQFDFEKNPQSEFDF